MGSRGADEVKIGSQAKEMVWPTCKLQRGLGRKVQTTWDQWCGKRSLADGNKQYSELRQEVELGKIP